MKSARTIYRFGPDHMESFNLHLSFQRSMSMVPKGWPARSQHDFFFTEKTPRKFESSPPEK